MAVVKIIRMRYWCNVLLNTFSNFFLFAKRYVSRGRFESHPRSFNIFVCMFGVKKTSNLSYIATKRKSCNVKIK